MKNVLAFRSARGFTLLECLVALAVLAVALTAALRAAGNTASSAEQLMQHTLASWVAHNHLAEMRALEVFPHLGVREGEKIQGGRQYHWQENVRPTPNPLFRRVDVHVRAAGSDAVLAQATGFAVRPLR